MQDRPVCFNCHNTIDTNAEMIFESPCGHDGCGSVVFHPLCLMEWRDKRAHFMQWLTTMRDRWAEEHGERSPDEIEEGGA